MSKKITELPAASAANLDQLFEVTNDPSGSPESQKLSVAQLQQAPTNIEPGSVVYAGDNGVLKGDPEEIFYDASTGMFGLKTDSPIASFQIGDIGSDLAPLISPQGIAVSTTSVTTSFTSQYTGANDAFSGSLIGLYQNSGSGVTNGTRLGGIAFGGRSNNDTIYPTGAINVYSSQDWNGTGSRGTVIDFETIVNAGGNRLRRVRVDQNGALLVGGGTVANSSAILEAASTTKGFLPPRVTTAQKNAIASPEPGLIVYDTSLGKLCVRGASAWETISST